MPLPDEGLIHAWLDGELDADTAARVEALVANDEAWSAAVAEARGLIAASSRIAASLDRPAGAVVPRARRATRWWMMRAAAVLVTVVGVSVLLRNGGAPPLGDEPPAPAAAMTRVPAPVANQTAPAAKAAPKPVIVAGKVRQQPGASSALAEMQRSGSAADLELVKRKEVEKTRQAKDALSERLTVAGAAGATAAPAAATAPAPLAPAVAAERRRAAEKTADTAGARARGFAVLDATSRNAAAQAGVNAKPAASPETVTCFRVVQPADSADRILRLRLADVTDSVRTGRYRENRDSLVGLTGRLVALRLRCPER